MIRVHFCILAFLCILIACKPGSYIIKDSNKILVAFQDMPVEIFDHTTEGMSETGKSELITRGSHLNWEMAVYKNHLLFTDKRGQSNVLILGFKSRDGNNIYATHTQNGRNNILEIWVHSGNNFSKIEALPRVNIMDFFDKNSYFENMSDFDSLIYYYIDEDQNIKAAINTWMEEKFENIAVQNEVFIEFNGREFKKSIKTIKDEGL